MLSTKTLGFKIVNGYKFFELFAEPVKQEILPGVFINAWGYNGSTPGPTIQVFSGDNVIIRIHNKLPEGTSVHWHGLIVPNDMDGVPGIEPSPLIKPGEYFDYEFKIVDPPGTHMYHSHANSIVQDGKGLVGGFIIADRPDMPVIDVDKDYFFMMQEWFLENMKMGTVVQGTYDVNPFSEKFNFFTLNGHCYPSVPPVKCKLGDWVRIRFGNFQMDHHPMHLHGFQFYVTASDGNPISTKNMLRKNTILVASGETWDVVFKADNLGRWPFHCHMPHHMANNMAPGFGGLTLVVEVEP